MRKLIQWSLPVKISGKSRKRWHVLTDDTYQMALDQLAKNESKRLGVKVSQSTLIVDLTTRDANFFRTKRTELREIIEQLNKEKHRENIEQVSESLT